MPLARREFLRLSAAALIFPAVALATTRSSGLRSSDKGAGELHFAGKSLLSNLLQDAATANWKDLPMGDLVGLTGLYFLETPYVSHTLDHSADHEFCIVNLQELDCVTFVESALATARLIKLGQSNRIELAKQIEQIRYRNGLRNGFCSRLHYLTDWFRDNEKRCTLKNVTAQLPGAISYKKTVSLMSARPQQYLQLRKHPEWIPVIAKREREINAEPASFLPKAAVPAAEPLLMTGDIVAITTQAKILDCAHVGLCFRDDTGVLRFLHASSKHGRVVLDSQLSEYLESVSAFTGVMVGRPLEPTLS